jgi:predicted Zn-dependent protease
MRKILPALPLLLALALILSLALAMSPPLAAQAKLAPPSAETQKTIQAALAKVQAGDVAGGIALLEPLKTGPGSHPAALSLLGSLYLRAGRPADALALLGPIADTDAAGPMILGNAAQAAFAVGQTAKAETYLRRAVARAPGSPAARDLGMLLGGDGRLAESYGLLRPWALANPDDSEARLAAAFAAVELQHADEGEELLKGLPQDNPRIQLLRARLLALEKAPQGAIALLEPILRNGPPELLPEVQRTLARLYMDTGGARKTVELLRGKTEGDPSLALLLGRAQNQTGDAAAAAEALAPFAKAGLADKEPATPGDRAAAAALELEYGQALLTLSKPAEAIPALDLSTRLDPSSARGWQLLGQAQLAAGQRDAAAKSAAKAKALGGGKP